MAEITINSNNKKISHLIHYPDGIKRILTMKKHEWDWIEQAEINGYMFNDILGEAISFASSRPSGASGKGLQYDILDSTRYLLWTVISLIHEKNNPPANEGNWY